MRVGSVRLCMCAYMCIHSCMCDYECHSLMCVCVFSVWVKPCLCLLNTLCSLKSSVLCHWGGQESGQAPKKEVTSIFIALDMHMLTTFNMPWQGKVLLRRKEVGRERVKERQRWWQIRKEYLWEMSHVRPSLDPEWLQLILDWLFEPSNTYPFDVLQ